MAVPCHLSITAAVLSGDARIIPAAPDMGLILRVRHGAILHHQVGVVGLWGAQGCLDPPRASGAGRCCGWFWDDAPSPPNPPRALLPLTTGVEDDLQVPVVAVGLSQGDAGGGSRAGPGISIGSQGMGWALQPCEEEEEVAAGQPLMAPTSVPHPPGSMPVPDPALQRWLLPASSNGINWASSQERVPTDPDPLLAPPLPAPSITSPRGRRLVNWVTLGVPPPKVGWGKGFFAYRECKRMPREMGLVSS